MQRLQPPRALRRGSVRDHRSPMQSVGSALLRHAATAWLGLVLLAQPLVGCANPGSCPNGTEWSGLACVHDQPWQPVRR